MLLDELSSVFYLCYLLDINLTTPKNYRKKSLRLSSQNKSLNISNYSQRRSTLLMNSNSKINLYLKILPIGKDISNFSSRIKNHVEISNKTNISFSINFK